MGTTLRNEAVASYMAINSQWLKFHFRMLQVGVLISALFELLFYVIIQLTGAMNDSIFWYWMKYILVPISVGVVILVLAKRVYMSEHLSIVQKEYRISFLFVCEALNLSFIHSGNISILFVNVIPILMSVIYENKRLTSLVSISGLFIEIICAFVTFWDLYKVIDYEYIINLIVILIITCVIWQVCFMMIRFAKMKKEITIHRDMERQILRQRIHRDELTKVGNRQAMLNHLKDLDQQSSAAYFIAMIDIDEFKSINDHFGHLFGDKVLRCFGECLGNISDFAYAYRYGGDEFCIVFLETKQETVLQEMRWLQNSFKKRLDSQGCGKVIHFSTGLAKGLAKDIAVDIVAQADEALYEAKKLNKERICVYKVSE